MFEVTQFVVVCYGTPRKLMHHDDSKGRNEARLGQFNALDVLRRKQSTL